MRRIILTLIFLILGFGLMGMQQPQQTRTIRVGVYENAPKIYTASDGKVSGFWPDLIQSIAIREGWEIIWVHGTWEECLARLEANEIDIMPDAGWTADRSQKFAFSTETVLTSWARIYTQKDSGIETILDLEGKTIAGLTGSLNFDGPEGIKALTSKFDVHAKFVEENSYVKVFEALKNKQVDAGITNKDFGDLNEAEYGLTRTPIIIQPTQILFAFTKNAELTPYLSQTIDTNIKAMKADSKSVYYQAMDNYLGEKPVKTFIEIIPPWVYTLLWVAAGVIFFLLAVSFTTRSQVRRQTIELRASESRNRALLENNPDLIFRLNGDGVFLDYHASAGHQLITLPENFLGRNVREVLPSDLTQTTLDKVKLALETRVMQIHEYQIPFEDDIRYVEARYTASGENEVIAIVRDISAKKQVEMELQESEERYQTLARVSPVGIFRTNKYGLTTYVNPTWCRISGLSADEALGEGWLKVVHPDDRTSLRENWEKSAKLQIPSLADYRFVQPDGSITWVIGQAMPEMNDDNQVVGYVGTITDITERKQVEIALQRSIIAERAALKIKETIQAANLALSRLLGLDEVLEVLFDYTSEIIPFDKASVILQEGNSQLVLRASRGYTNATDLTIDHNILSIIQNNPALNSVKVGQHSYCIDDTNQYPEWNPITGGTHGRSWLGVPLIAGGQVLGLFSLEKTTPGFFTVEFCKLAESLAVQAAVAIQNARLHEELKHYATELEQRVTDRTTELAKRVSEVESLNESMLRLNENLKKAVKKAESADRLKSAFLATMSHELRTPLNSIIGFTGILLQKMVGPLSEEQEKQLGMVQGSARHLLDLINDVLDISKIEADQIVLSDENFDMGESVQKSIEKILPMAEKKGLNLITEIVPQKIMISNDRRRVEQILLNLLNNAVKFTDRGQVKLDCRIENGLLVTRISDTGIGIKPEDLQTLFKPFRQIDTGLTRQYEGTGLGLSICKRLVELMGGDILAKSEAGKGSIFTFTLPLQRN